MIEAECSCHLHPPCDFCVNMTEEEVSVYTKRGLDALRDFRAASTTPSAPPNANPLSPPET